MRGWMLPALLTLAIAAPAQAQSQQGTPPAGKQQVRMAKGSPAAKVFFSEPALLLNDDGTYSGAMQRVGQEVQRECGAVEAYGWDFKGEPKERQQQRADAVFQGTTQAFKNAGYTLSEKKVRAIPDPESVVYTAENKEKRLILLWSPVQDATLLLVCDAGAAPPAAPAPKAAPPAKK